MAATSVEGFIRQKLVKKTKCHSMAIQTCVVCLEGLVCVVEYQVTAPVEVGVLELGHDPQEAGRRGDQYVRAVQDGGLHALLLFVDAAGGEAPFVVRHDLRNIRENGLCDSFVLSIVHSKLVMHAAQEIGRLTNLVTRHFRRLVEWMNLIDEQFPECCDPSRRTFSTWGKR